MASSIAVEEATMENRQRTGHPSRTRVQGPLAAHADGFRREMTALGYSETQVREHVKLAAHLSSWLEGCGLAARDLTMEGIAEFLDARGRQAGRGLSTGRGLAPLLRYLRALDVVPEPGDQVPATPAEALLAEYRDYLRSQQGLAPTTAARYLYWAKVLAGWLDGAAMTALSAGQVADFVAAEVRRRNRAHARSMVTALRSLLRFLHAAGHVPHPLAAAVPSVPGWRARDLPRAAAPGQIAAVLAACDRRSAAGRRDYAIILAQVRLGLRAAEVAAIELADISWLAGELTVHGKGGRTDILPLPADVGEAVAGYLRHGRPRTPERRLFTSVIAPFGGLGSRAITEVVARACDRAQIARFGSHRLRHALACQLLAEGASLAEIGQLLRHASERTTFEYAKVDQARLAGLAMPCPPGAAQ
jgi:integrase/recombinase XerD